MAGTRSGAGRGCRWAGGAARAPIVLPGDSLAFSSSLYAEDDEGRFAHAGVRPSGGWHGHGYTESWPWLVRGGAIVCVCVRKHRWRHCITGRTVTSQPPDLLPRRRACTLLIAGLLLAALCAPVGLHTRGPDAPGVRSIRQQQRDLAAACSLAQPSQQAIRIAVMERSAPRPAETLWKAGLDPPRELTRRCLHPSAPVTWTALEILRVSAEQLRAPTSILLAEARGRWAGPETRFII